MCKPGVNLHRPTLAGLAIALAAAAVAAAVAAAAVAGNANLRSVKEPVRLKALVGAALAQGLTLSSFFQLNFKPCFAVCPSLSQYPLKLSHFIIHRC